MSTAVITLGGAVVAASGPVSWAQTTGVSAPFQTFMIHEKSWNIIEEAMGSFVQLRGSIPWDKLFLVREVPTSHPKMRAVLVSDVRYLWPREIIVRSMNIPRKTGDKRMTEGQIVELQSVYDTYQYAAASLDREGRRWTAKSAVQSILQELARKCDHEWRIESMPVKEERELTVEGVEFADPGDAALGKILMHIPHAEITVNARGEAVVFDGTDLDKSEAMMEGAPPATAAGQIDRIIDLSSIRPSSIFVYFAKEIELRFDSVTEGTDGGSTSQAPDPPGANEPMTMDNVLPLPDTSTTIDGKVYSQGTYVSVEKALAAWNDGLPTLGKPVEPPILNVSNVRKHWWVLESLYTPLGNLNLSASQVNWAARIATLRQHYRQTFRINPKWMEAIRDLIPYRVGVLDPVTGARAPSQAWSQYCIEPTSKLHTLAKLANDDELQFYWLNCDSYPGIDTNLWTKAPAPAHVQVADRDLGILHIDYQSDRYQNRSNIHPSMMRNNQSGKVLSPTRDLSRQLLQVIAKDAKLSGSAHGLPLAEEFKVAIIITAMPFKPNDEGRLYRWEVDPSEIQQFLSTRFQVKGGSGKPWHLFVPPTLMTAWHALEDTVSGRTGARQLFGFQDPVEGPDNGIPGYRVINDDSMIPAMARAVALAQWAAFVSQREGTRAIHLTTSMEPAGAIQTVRHSIGPGGRRITEVSMPSSRRPTSALAFIAQEERPMILGQIPNIRP